jgi:hypothetical protein
MRQVLFDPVYSNIPPVVCHPISVLSLHGWQELLGLIAAGITSTVCLLAANDYSHGTVKMSGRLNQGS